MLMITDGHCEEKFTGAFMFVQGGQKLRSSDWTPKKADCGLLAEL